MTAGTLWTIDIQATAPKAQIQQRAVVRIVDAIYRRDHLRGRGVLGQVVARIFAGAIKLQLGQLLMFGFHERVLEFIPK